MSIVKTIGNQTAVPHTQIYGCTVWSQQAEKVIFQKQKSPA